jgi:hypothetical protein
MRYQLLAGRLYAVAIIASVLACILFITGASQNSDMSIYAGTAMVVVMATAAVGSLVLTVIEAVICRQDDRRRDAEDS